MKAIFAAFSVSTLRTAGFLAALGLAAFVLPQAALAQGVTDSAASAPSVREARVAGFRSARFGMSEDEVRAAAALDFGIAPEDMVDGINTVERTRVLTALVPDVLPEGGIAQLSYIFGYRSKALIQVGVLWATTTDPELKPQTIAANGDVLQAHFLGAGYRPDSITADMMLDTGILLFRGADAEGRTVILLLQGRFADNVPGRLPLTATSLTLLYAEDPDRPDIFRLEDGNF